MSVDQGIERLLSAAFSHRGKCTGALVAVVMLEPASEAETPFTSWLSGKEIERSRSFVFAEDRKCFLMTHALKRLMLGAATQTAHQQLVFSCDAFGKPHLAGSGVEFSMSHTRGLGAVALSWSEPVGVDAESVKNGNDAQSESFNQLVLSAAEAAIVRQSADPARTLIRYWTAKEAVSKAAGVGLSMPFSDILIEENFATSACRRWYVRHHFPTDDHVVAVAWPAGRQQTYVEPVFLVVHETDLWAFAQHNNICSGPIN